MEIGFVHLGRENLGVQYLSSVLKRAGHRTRLFYDPGLFGPNDNVFYVKPLERRFSRFDGIVRDILASPPDVLAFSAYTNTFRWTLAVLEAVRRGGYKGRVLFGGIHATLVPETVLFETKADAVTIGETEGVILDLLDALFGGRPMSEVGNLAFFDGDRVVRTPLLPAIPDLDAIPLPDKALFEAEVNYEDDYLIMTGRGCPHSCSFCCESAYNRLYKNRFFRRRSPEGVIEELVSMRHRYQFREVMFNDAMFFTSARWLKDFLALYRRKVNLPFRCFAYPKYITSDIAEELKGSNCYAVEFGLQTTNEEIRKDLLNRRETNEQALGVFRMMDKIGLSYDIDHIFGIPGEKEEDFFDAARLYGSLRGLNRIKCHLLAYFPGTPLVERAVKEGIIPKEELERINRGEIGDFFHSPTVDDEETLGRIREFSRLFKFLPILPKPVLEKILKTRLRGWIGRLPGVVIIFLQILGAFRGRDYRFWLYTKYYFHRLTRHFLLRR